jgi:drug/metabolite transporter (DMT)-like permease
MATSPTSPAPRLGLLYAFAGSFFAACFLIPWKVAADHGAPDEATLALLASAAVFNSFAAALPIARASERQVVSLALTVKLAVAFAVLSLAGNLFSAEAVLRISGALLSVMQRCEVLVVGLLGIFVLGERAGPSFWVGTALAGAGLILLGQPVPAYAVTAGGQQELIGALFGLGSAVCFGAMAVLTRKHIHAIRPVLLNGMRLWFGVALWFALEWRLPALSGQLVLYAALAAFFGPFLSRLAVMASARHVKASTTALAGLATPVITLLLGFLLLGSIPTRVELLGGAIMLIGVALPIVAVRRSGA